MTATDKTILCLCHDEMTLRVRQLLLEYFGFRVLATESADELGELIRQKCPNLLLMDDAYPGIDYKWTAEKAKALCPDILAVVLVDGYTLRSDAEGPVDRFLNLDGPREEWLAQIQSLLADHAQHGTADRSM
jgi:CheY-like chemotaxis protein